MGVEGLDLQRWTRLVLCLVAREVGGQTCRLPQLEVVLGTLASEDLEAEMVLGEVMVATGLGRMGG